MGRLKGENLEFFVTHYEKFGAAYKTQIYFCFDTKQDGKSAFVMLKNVYAAECNYSAYGADYRDFYLGFTSKATRDQVLTDIEQSVQAYQAQHGTDLSMTSADKNRTVRKDNTMFYLIAGAVVAVLIALFLNRKKKK